MFNEEDKKIEDEKVEILETAEEEAEVMEQPSAKRNKSNRKKIITIICLLITSTHSSTAY